ncbi:MAG: DUF4234 domain-containing protein [Lachnospiraceae bacterium]|nr:DUF4234 domain-containing protein [Lachnospiraceae bacterium]
MICKKCGADIANDTKFCPSCGSPIEFEDAAYTAPQGDPSTASGSYGQQTASQTVYNTPGGQGKNRNIALCIIFSIITCGIYGLYWMCVLNDELNSLSGDTNSTSGGLVVVFSIITCGIYTWYWYFKMGDKVNIVKTNSGMKADSYNIIFLLLGIFGLGIINYALMQDTINKAVA